MNYLLLFRNFLAVREVVGFTHAEFVLYSMLLEKCNCLGWPKWFTLTNNALQLMANISRTSLDKCRDKLVGAGLIEYRPGNINGQAPAYRILPPGAPGQQLCYPQSEHTADDSAAGDGPAQDGPAQDGPAQETPARKASARKARPANTGTTADGHPEERKAPDGKGDDAGGGAPEAGRQAAQEQDPAARQEGFFRDYCSGANSDLRLTMLEELRRDNPDINDDVGLLALASEAHYGMVRRRQWHDDYPAYALHLENLIRVINRKKHESNLKKATRNERTNTYWTNSRRANAELEKERRQQEFRDHIAEKLARGQAAMLAQS